MGKFEKKFAIGTPTRGEMDKYLVMERVHHPRLSLQPWRGAHSLSAPSLFVRGCRTHLQSLMHGMGKMDK